MSLDSAISRISQLQAMLAGTAPPAPATTATSPTAFAGALATATDGSTANATLAAMSSPLGAAVSAGDDTTGDGSTTDPAAALAAMSSPLGAATTTGLANALPASVPYGAQITAAATANGIDPALLAGLIKQESGFNPNAGSPAGARGLTQLMPGTAATLGVSNVLDPAQSIQAGAKYLKQQLDTFGGDVTKALAAYNAGPGAVQRFGGVPPYAETQNYVRAVQANAASFRSPTT
jgi:soluble lytic murein transglycosylase-like protein